MLTRGSEYVFCEGGASTKVLNGQKLIYNPQLIKNICDLHNAIHDWQNISLHIGS